MDKRFKESAAAYSQERDELTQAYPISHIDSQILQELCLILKKKDKDLYRILEQYKNVHDEDILEALQTFNECVDEQGEVTKGKKTPTIPWIDILGSLLCVPLIVSFTKDVEYRQGKLYYLIIVNKGPLPLAHCNYEDLTFSFHTSELRDSSYRDIKEKLIGTGAIKFM